MLGARREKSKMLKSCKKVCITMILSFQVEIKEDEPNYNKAIKQIKQNLINALKTVPGIVLESMSLVRGNTINYQDVWPANDKQQPEGYISER